MKIMIEIDQRRAAFVDNPEKETSRIINEQVLPRIVYIRNDAWNLEDAHGRIVGQVEIEQ